MDALTLILFVLGLVILVLGAELLVRGASRLAVNFGVSPLIVGLTVVAFGTSAPEMAVSVRSAFASQSGADIAIGNVVGSNIFNVLLILGISAIVAPLLVSQQLVRRDVPIMIAISALLYWMAADGTVSRPEGVLLFAGVLLYTGFAISESKKELREVQAEYEAEFGYKNGRVAWSLGMILIGLAMLVAGSHWLVQGAVFIATSLGISDLVIGLTIVAAGTSLPEVATSIMASFKGERDIAVGNVVGSNIFNILAVLGLSAMVAPDGVKVAPAALNFDIPVMLAVAIACLPVCFTGYVISRWEGVVFLGYYAAYTTWLILNAGQYQVLSLFGAAMVYFVVPLTLLTLLILVGRQLRYGIKKVSQDGH
ncbi:MAG: calcium/sodium antiporter [Gammaproteobacteria bacterium]